MHGCFRLFCRSCCQKSRSSLTILGEIQRWVERLVKFVLSSHTIFARELVDDWHLPSHNSLHFLLRLPRTILNKQFKYEFRTEKDVISAGYYTVRRWDQRPALPAHLTQPMTRTRNPGTPPPRCLEGDIVIVCDVKKKSLASYYLNTKILFFKKRSPWIRWQNLQLTKRTQFLSRRCNRTSAFDASTYLYVSLRLWKKWRLRFFLSGLFLEPSCPTWVCFFFESKSSYISRIHVDVVFQDVYLSEPKSSCVSDSLGQNC